MIPYKMKMNEILCENEVQSAGCYKLESIEIKYNNNFEIVTGINIMTMSNDNVKRIKLTCPSLSRNKHQLHFCLFFVLISNLLIIFWCYISGIEFFGIQLFNIQFSLFLLFNLAKD